MQLSLLPAWPRYGPISSRTLTVLRGPPPRKPSKRAKYGFKRIGEDWGDAPDTEDDSSNRISGLLRRSRLPRSWKVLRAHRDDAEDEVWEDEAMLARKRKAKRPRRLTADQVGCALHHATRKGHTSVV